MNGLFDFSGMSAVVYKELRQILRSPVTLALAVGVPLLQLLLLGYAINTTVEHVPAAVYREDRGPAAQAFIDSLDGSRTFEVVEEVSNRQGLIDAIVAGKVRAAFRHPAKFYGRSLGRAPSGGRGVHRRLGFVDCASCVRICGSSRRNSAARPHARYRSSPFEVRPVCVVQSGDAQRELLRPRTHWPGDAEHHDHADGARHRGRARKGHARSIAGDADRHGGFDARQTDPLRPGSRNTVLSSPRGIAYSYLPCRSLETYFC